MPVVKKVKRKWLEADLKKALEDVKSNILSIRTAAKTYGMTEGTIRLRLKKEKDGKDYIGSGRRPTLDQRTETELARVVRVMCDLGFSPTRGQVKDLVAEYVKEWKLKTPFKEGRPGKDWLRLFMEISFP